MPEHAPRYKAPQAPHGLVAVDPGKVKCGLALFDVCGDESRLLAARTITIPYRGATPRAMAEAIARAVIACDALPVKLFGVAERPMKYDTQRAKHRDVQTLLDVVKVLGASFRPNWRTWSPGAWKGQVPKAAHHARVRRALTEAERAVLPNASEHDAIDAVGLGLFALGRTGRGGAR